MTPPDDRPCPCGSERRYAACCRPRHLGLAPAETAEALMRSRFAAFAEGRVGYLLETHHPSTRRLDDVEALRRSAETTRWTALRVLGTAAGAAGDDRGEVEFVAFFEQGGRRGELHERSRFTKENGRWLYLDGETPRRHRPPGRRERCWCGGGRRYRACHGVGG